MSDFAVAEGEFFREIAVGFGQSTSDEELELEAITEL